MMCIGLQPITTHAPSSHQVSNFTPGNIIADSTDEARRQPEYLQMPGDIKRRPAQHPTAVREIIKQHLAKNYWRLDLGIHPIEKLVA
jgi:hypothetical protein